MALSAFRLLGIFNPGVQAFSDWEIPVSGQTVGAVTVVIGTFTPPIAGAYACYVRTQPGETTTPAGCLHHKIATFLFNGTTTTRVGSGTRTYGTDREDYSTPDLLIAVAGNGVDIIASGVGRTANTINWRGIMGVDYLG